MRCTRRAAGQISVRLLPAPASTVRLLNSYHPNRQANRKADLMASDKALARICVRVFADDYEKDQKVAQARGVPVNVIIRECLHSFILRLNDLERRNLDTLQPDSLLGRAVGTAINSTGKTVLVE